jgi:[ribosomal protein S5]-alanine N-acetyltransferase
MPRPQFSGFALRVANRLVMLPELHTERLFLREVRLEDGPALQDYQGHPEHWRLQAIEPDEFADGTLRVRRYFQHCGSDAERRLFVYVARKKLDGELIGQVSLSRFFHPAVASIGFSVAVQHWGRGYASEMASRLITFGFNELRLHRISADVAVENEPCRRVLKKSGMTYEGIARDCIWAQGRWWSEVKYAILESDREKWNPVAAHAFNAGSGARP